jgi:hypothetical protein
MEWQDTLDNLPVEQQGRKKATEPHATNIVLGFMRHEIYPRLREAQDAFSGQGLQTTLLPASPEELSGNQPCVCISVQRKSNGAIYSYSLEFKREAGFDISVALFGKTGHPTYGTFAIDRKPEPPTTCVKAYVDDLKSAAQ